MSDQRRVSVDEMGGDPACWSGLVDDHRDAAPSPSTDDEVEQLHRALASRDLISQAKGLLMAQRRVTGEEAFAELVAMSQQQQQLKLRRVAARLVAGHEAAVRLERTAARSVGPVVDDSP